MLKDREKQILQMTKKCFLKFLNKFYFVNLKL